MVLITEKSLRQLSASRQLPTEFLLREGDRLTPSAKDFLLERKIPIVRTKDIEARHGELPSFPLIPVGVSNRHVHITEAHFHLLFGVDSELTEMRPLSQPGQFAAKETVTVVGPSGVIQNVRILGPFRKQTQVEVSRGDGFTLGIHPPLRLSGSIEGTPGITLVGAAGSVTLEEGVIVAQNHVHMSLEDARKFEVKNGDSIILASLKRQLLFPNVSVRVKESYCLDFHIDQDEANAAGLKTGEQVRVVGRNQHLFSPFIGVEQDG